MRSSWWSISPKEIAPQRRIRVGSAEDSGCSLKGRGFSKTKEGSRPLWLNRGNMKHIRVMLVKLSLDSPKAKQVADVGFCLEHRKVNNDVFFHGRQDSLELYASFLVFPQTGNSCLALDPISRSSPKSVDRPWAGTALGVYAAHPKRSLLGG